MVQRDLVQERAHAPERSLPRRVTLGAAACREGRSRQQGTVAGEPGEVAGERVHVAGRDEEALPPMLDELARPARRCRDHRHAEAHRLKVGDAEGLVSRREDEEVAAPQERGHAGVRDGSNELHVGADAGIEDELAQARDIAPAPSSGCRRP